MSELAELNKLIELMRLASQGGRAVIDCPSPGEARRTRRRIYRLCERLPPGWKLVADAIIFKLNGCEILIQLRSQISVPQNEPLPPTSVGLDDQK